MVKNKWVAAAVMASAMLTSPFSATAADTVSVAVSQIVEHPALDATRQGLLDGLKDKGFVEGENLNFTYQTAQGNPAIAVQIARQFVGENRMFWSVSQRHPPGIGSCDKVHTCRIYRSNRSCRCQASR